MIAGLVLAAGSSTRFGSTKQLLPLAGKPLVQHAVDAARDAGLDDVVVVVRPGAPSVAAAVRGARAVVNDRADQGQATSLVAGLGALDETTDAVVVLLADQPGVRASDVRALVERFSTTAEPVVRLRYADGPGPALLGRTLWDDLRRLEGDVGARDLIASGSVPVAEIDLPFTAPRDVDTWEDYDAVRTAGDPGPEASLRAALPREDRRLFDDVAAILFRLDPAHVSVGTNVGAYEPVAAAVTPLLHATRGALDVRDLIHREVVRWLGSAGAGPEAGYRAAAEEIAARLRDGG